MYYSKVTIYRNSLAVQWLRLRASTAGGTVGELRSCTSSDEAKKKSDYFFIKFGPSNKIKRNIFFFFCILELQCGYIFGPTIHIFHKELDTTEPLN